MEYIIAVVITILLFTIVPYMIIKYMIINPIKNSVYQHRIKNNKFFQSEIINKKEEFLYTDMFRTKDEKVALFFALSISTILFFILLGVTFGLILIVIVISIGWTYVQQGHLLGQSVKVSKNQFPELYNLAEIAAKRLCMPLPDVFIIQNPVINAFSIGFEGKQSIVLHSATIEHMNDNELLAIIGHEFTHIKAGHTNWLIIIGSYSNIKIPIVSQILNLIFLSWSRKAEYTADKGALIASRDSKATITALVKTAIGGKLSNYLNIEELFKQKTNIDENIVSQISEGLSTHPYLIHRIHKLREFYESPQYKKLINLSCLKLTKTEEDNDTPPQSVGKQYDNSNNINV